MNRANRWAATTACAAMVGLLVGCSQVSALAPVGGDDIATLRIAIDDVLAAASVPVLVSPTCTADGEAFMCKGSTTDGSPILATSPAGEPRTVTVTVGGDVLFDGEVQAVVEKAAEVGS